MAETGYIKILGSDDSIRLLETDIGATPASSNIIGMRRGYWTPQVVSGIGGGDLYYPDSDFADIGYKDLEQSFPSKSEVEYTCNIRFTGTWFQIPAATAFLGTGTVGTSYTPSNYWRLFFTAKASSSYWPSTSDRPYLKWEARKDSGSTILCSASQLITTSYSDYSKESSTLPGALLSTDTIELWLYIGYFTSSPS